MKRFGMICKTEFLLFVRDFFGFFFTFAFPLLMLLLFGGVYGNKPISPGSTVGFIDLAVPGYCVMVAGVTGLMSFPLTLAEYKERKIYKRFDASPAGKGQIIMAQVLINVLMTMVGFLVLLIAGKLLYKIQIQGSALAIFTAVLCSIAAMFSMGFLFTAIGRDTKITNLLCYLFYFVMVFLSGATIPQSAFPPATKTISSFLPMTYGVNLMQGMFLGDTFSQHTPDLTVLVGLTILCTAAGGLLYRKKDWA